MTRVAYISLSVIIALSTLMNIFAFEKGHYWGDDFALYIAQAKSLVEGNPEMLLRQNTFAMSHSSYPIGPNLVPWGLPIILSPIYAIFGLNLIPLKIPGLILFELSLIVIFFLFLGKLNSSLTILLASFFAFNPFFLLLNDTVNSDTAYLFFSLLSVFMIQKTIIEQRLSEYRVIRFLLIGFLIFLSCFTRVIGIALLFLLITVQLIHISRTHGINSLKYSMTNKFIWLPYSVFAVFQGITYLLLPSGVGSYFSYIPSINLRSIKNQMYYYATIPSEFFNAYFPSVMYGVTIPFVALGIKRNFKIDYPYVIYAFITLSILVIVPYPGGLRYILPIFPFYIYFFCIGLDSSYLQFHISIFRFILTIKPSCIFLGIFICLLVCHSSWVAYIMLNNNHVVDGPFTKTSLEMFNFISNHTDKSDIIIFFKPRILRLLTSRQSLMMTDFSQLMESNSHYLVIRKIRGIHDPIPPG